MLDLHIVGVALRVLIIIVCGMCLYLLTHRFFTKKHLWNGKTRDYWFAVVMWSIAGFTIAVQGLLEGRGVTPPAVLVTVAAIATLHGLWQKGPWGADE